MGWVWRHMQGDLGASVYKSGIFCANVSPNSRYFYPTVEEVAADWGLNVKINEGNKEVHFYYGRQYRGTTICRSMEKPQTIVGFKIGNALVDELDILPKEKAENGVAQDNCTYAL